MSSVIAAVRKRAFRVHVHSDCNGNLKGRRQDNYKLLERWRFCEAEARQDALVPERINIRRLGITKHQLAITFPFLTYRGQSLAQLLPNTNNDGD